jgi:hypothetical protein
MTDGRPTMPIVIAIKQTMDSTSIALVPIVAANMMRVVDADRDRGAGGAATNVAATPSSGSQALALMMMFDVEKK